MNELLTLGISHKTAPVALRERLALTESEASEFVKQADRYKRPFELKHLRGDSSKVRQTLGWEPKYTFEQLIDEMIAEIEREFYGSKATG